jgi:hypothetical protein
MADKKLTLIVDAKNKTAGALQSASGSLSSFAKSANAALAPLRSLWQAVYGPMALVIAATMAFSRIMRGLTSIITKAGTEIRKLAADKAARDFESWGRAVSDLSRVFKEVNRDIKNARDGEKAQRDAVTDLTKAQRENAKAKAMSAAGSEEERDAIEKQFDAEEKRIEALNEITKIKDQIKKADQDSEVAAKMLAANDRKSLDIIKQSEAASTRLAEIREKVAKEKKVGTTARGGGEYLKGLQDEEKEAEQSLQRILDAETNLFNETDDIRAAQTLRAKERTALETALRAKQLEHETLLITQQDDILNQKHDDYLKREEKKNEEIKKLTDERTQLESQAVDQLGRVHEQNWQRQKANMEQQLELQDAIAKAAIKDVIAEAKAKKGSDKDAERMEGREARKAARLGARFDRGESIGKGAEEWLNAFREREKARGGIAGLKEGIDTAQKNLDALQDQGKTLTKIEVLLAGNLAKIDQKIRLG